MNGTNGLFVAAKDLMRGDRVKEALAILHRLETRDYEPAIRFLLEYGSRNRPPGDPRPLR
jgi:hypothetical protein